MRKSSDDKRKVSMNPETESKVKKEAKQIGLDIVIGVVIVSLLVGFAMGVWIAP